MKASQITVRPDIPLRDFKDPRNVAQRAVLPAGRSAITSTSPWKRRKIAVDAGFTLVQNSAAQPLPRIRSFEDGDVDCRQAKPGYQQAEAIRAWIHRKRSSTESTSAMDTTGKRPGSPGFFSLAIALCRALRIPARIVVGYLHLLDPMDLHAWFEAFVGERWYTSTRCKKRLAATAL